MTNVHGLTNEFYEAFWNELKEIFIDSVLESKEKGHLRTFQRHAVIKLTENKDRQEIHKKLETHFFF